MKFQEYLIESATMNEYLSMFAKLLAYITPENQMMVTVNQHNVEDVIKELKAKVKRKDRIIYLLKIYRVWFAIKLSYSMSNILNDAEEQKLTKYVMSLRNEYRWMTDLNTGHILSYYKLLLEQIAHFISLPIPAIKNVDFSNQDPNDITTQFGRLEKEWAKKNGQEVEAAGRKILDVGKGFAWYNLDVASCPIEAKAMGHCGNSATKNSKERILSLRELKPNGKLVPHCTFIIDEKGMLGEMKGRGNEKPSSKYYEYIIPLLLMPKVKGIKGGGYLPENNFHVSHLDETQQVKLIEKKPLLFDFGSLVTVKSIPKLEKIMNKVGMKVQIINDQVYTKILKRNIHNFCEEFGWSKLHPILMDKLNDNLLGDIYHTLKPFGFIFDSAEGDIIAYTPVARFYKVIKNMKTLSQDAITDSQYIGIINNNQFPSYISNDTEVDDLFPSDLEQKIIRAFETINKEKE